MQHFVPASLIAVFALSAPGCAQADDGANDSAYVRVFDDCTTREAEDDPVFYSDCAGYGAWTVHILAGEHGAAVAYSRRGLEAQWSESPPRVGVFQDLGQVMEWRLPSRRSIVRSSRAFRPARAANISPSRHYGPRASWALAMSPMSKRRSSPMPTRSRAMPPIIWRRTGSAVSTSRSYLISIQRWMYSPSRPSVGPVIDHSLITL